MLKRLNKFSQKREKITKKKLKKLIKKATISNKNEMETRFQILPISLKSVLISP